MGSEQLRQSAENFKPYTALLSDLDQGERDPSLLLWGEPQKG